ncbi:MAG: NADH-quinone oxidoreductase subunit C [bacterium]|nr:NADH-quinone oxidoreductase subunit C [bacterium]
MTIAVTQSEQIAAVDLLASARRVASGTDPVSLIDWYARRCRGRGSALEGILQLRSDSGRRWQWTVADADELPSLTSVWPAANWPQREAVERIGLRFAGESAPAPLWTSAVRAAHDEEDGADDGTEADGFVCLGDPATTTQWRLDLRVQLRRRIVERVQATPGKTFSGFEDLATRHGYAQLPPLAEGLNDQAPFAVGLAAILAVEALLNIEPPSRCRRLRMLLAEISRIGAHCAWLATQAGLDQALWGEALVVREAVARLLSDLTGRRWATGVHRIGGVHAEATAHTPQLLADLAIAVDTVGAMAQQRLLDSRTWRRRFSGATAIDADTARNWALTGPMLRATGVACDVRKDTPYLDYAEVEFDVAIGTDGDVADRVAVRLAEMQQSIGICRQCLRDLPQGPTGLAPASTASGVAERIGHFELWMDGHGYRTIPGTTYLPTESADGELAMWLAADGTGKPAAVHLRSPSLYNFQLLEHLLPGTRLEHAAGVVASLNIVAPEMDR